MTKLRNLTPIAFLTFVLALVACSSSEKTDTNESVITRMAQQDSTISPFGKLTGIRDDLRFDSTRYPKDDIIARLNWENGSIRRMVVRPDSVDRVRTVTVEWDEDGFLTQTRELVARIPDGKTMVWHKSGSLESLANFRRGVLNDTLYLFWPDGRPKQIETYVDGKRNGIWYKFDETGQLMKQGFFVNDSLDGEFTEWDEKGNLKFKGHYLNNKMTGEWEKFYENGRLRAIAEYRSGKRHGKNISWDDLGALLVYDWYIDDKRVPWPDSLPRPKDLAVEIDELPNKPIKIIRGNGQ